MSLEDISLGDAMKLASMFNGSNKDSSLNCMVGKKCVIRTYSAGVWFGEIEQKEGNEVIVKNARRLWFWKAKKSISLSAVAKYGISDESKISPEVENVWLEAIELIPASKEAIKTIEDADDAKAQ